MENKSVLNLIEKCEDKEYKVYSMNHYSPNGLEHLEEVFIKISNDKLCSIRVITTEFLSDDKNNSVKREAAYCFNLYSNQMLNDNFDICFWGSHYIFGALSSILKRKYIFHKDGLPTMTIDGSNTYQWKAI